ncbi:RNA polymerase sigma factor [Conexibacter sp. S30A1]|uniref:RNA polymerase sigma factor n=1 Tax=Conexibacter sp. S30A1 TaxID=2937800 RepID=UPI00200D4C16|nr:sigma-70 family RNA polymerase sigma factor [Conexibacter sp. S30A1]
MSASPDDAAVIAASLERPQEFTLIFERHFDEIHRYLRRRHPAAAEELAAEVFMTAFDLRGRYRPESQSARPWLYGIASRLLARRRRSELRSLRAHARSGGRRELTADVYAEAVERADAQRDSARVAAALATLKAADRDTLLLYALGGLSYEEVAQALEVPVGTVRSRLARARQRCAALLATETPQTEVR